MTPAACCAATATALVLCLATTATSQEGADMVISGQLNHQGVLDVEGEPASTVGLSAARYIFEAPPSKVGVVQPLDMALVDALCRDLEGCRITLQAVNWDPFNAPGGVMSTTSRLFLSETSNHFRFDESQALWSVDDNGGPLVFQLLDCKFTDAESPNEAQGPNSIDDNDVGFGLLNCQNLEFSFCTLNDSTTTCRVVLED